MGNRVLKISSRLFFDVTEARPWGELAIKTLKSGVEQNHVRFQEVRSTVFASSPQTLQPKCEHIFASQNW